MHEIKELYDLEPLMREKNYPLEIEIGCGNGHFITEYGNRRKDRILIGIEIKEKRCLKSVKKAEQKKLDNIHIVCGRAEDILKRIPVGRIEAYHIYFPDPWPKNRHRRRRLFRGRFLEYLHASLSLRGKVYFATDFFDYYLQAKILILLHPGLKLIKMVPPQEWQLSLFRRRFLNMKKAIYFVSAIKE